jgi:hypothetical protein
MKDFLHLCFIVSVCFKKNKSTNQAEVTYIQDIMLATLPPERDEAFAELKMNLLVIDDIVLIQ